MAHDREHSSLGGEGDCSPANWVAGDLSGMVVRFWRHFPPELVLDAIDQILDHSKTDDTQIALKASAGPDRTLTIKSTVITFGSVYQYRLFELLPVLRELDPSKAEQLSNDPQVQAQLNKYPSGLQSLDPTVRDTPLRKGEESGMLGVSMTSPGASGKVLQDWHSGEIYQRQANVAESKIYDRLENSLQGRQPLDSAEWRAINEALRSLRSLRHYIAA